MQTDLAPLPTANLFSLGLHWTHRAARFSLRMTSVGTHSVPSWLQTYLEINFKKIYALVCIGVLVVVSSEGSKGAYEFLSCETVTILLDFKLQSIPHTI
jgi:hypothetical protein